MKTTELFVDQLLIGLLVVVTVLALSPIPPPDLTETDLGKAAALVAAAYFAGILYDRFADTLLQDQEKHHRLVRALRKPSARKPGESGNECKEYFPIGKYRMAVLGKGQASDYADYLRSRLRLTRALASLLPAMSVALVAYLAGSLAMKCGWTQAADATTTILTCRFAHVDASVASPARTVFESWGLLALVAAVYGGIFVTQLAKPTLLNREADGLRFTARRFWGTPPTTRLSAGEADMYAALLGGETRSRDDDANDWNVRPIVFTALRIDPLLFLGAGLMFALGGFLVAESKIASLAVIPVAGMVLTALSGWTWWRIHDTYLKFIRQFAEYESKQDRGSKGG